MTHAARPTPVVANQTWFKAVLQDNYGFQEMASRYATDCKTAINAWEQNGWKVIFVVDEFGNDCK